MGERPDLLGPEDNFLGIDSDWGSSSVMIWPVPMEQSTSYMQGTGRGPGALLEASRQVELFDDELGVETFRRGIVTLTPLKIGAVSVESTVRHVQEQALSLLKHGKRLVTVGGEHSVTVGLVQAHHSHDSNFSVLHLDAHADLRESYGGTGFSHACVMARVRTLVPHVSVGIRSLCFEEAEQIQSENLSVFTVHTMRQQDDWLEKAVGLLRRKVYITLDLDVLDPSVMPSVGTPEPNGMDWPALTSLLKKVFQERDVIGMDMVELCPMHSGDFGPFTAAKLLYRLIGYWLA
ncbi:MAG TPA: agmatinase [bacterium]|nr:agmatinase [bacterium]